MNKNHWVFFVCILVAHGIGACENNQWIDEWASGARSFKDEKYEEAIGHYSKALELKEKECWLKHPQILYLRALAYTELRRFDEALADIDHLDRKLKERDFYRYLALELKTKIYWLKDDFEEWKNIRAYVDMISPIKERYEEIGEWVIVTNAQFILDSRARVEKLRSLLLESGVIDSPLDFITMDEGTYIYKRSSCGDSGQKKANH